MARANAVSSATVEPANNQYPLSTPSFSANRKRSLDNDDERVSGTEHNNGFREQRICRALMRSGWTLPTTAPPLPSATALASLGLPGRRRHGTVINE